MAQDIQARESGSNAMMIALIAIVLVACIGGFLYFSNGIPGTTTVVNANNPNPPASNTTVINPPNPPASNNTVINPPATVNVNPAPAPAKSDSSDSSGKAPAPSSP